MNYGKVGLILRIQNKTRILTNVIITGGEECMTYNPDEEWYTIQSRYFTAAIEVKNETVTECEPILKYMKGWSMKRVVSYCKQKGWKID